MKLAHAIFASLELQPMTRYDLKKFVDMLVGHFSTTLQSRIDMTLPDLEQDGWVEKNSSNRRANQIVKSIRSLKLDGPNCVAG